MEPGKEPRYPGGSVPLLPVIQGPSFLHTKQKKDLPEEWEIEAGGGSGYHDPALIAEENALAQGAGHSSRSGPRLHFVCPRPLVTLSLLTACGSESMAQ